MTIVCWLDCAVLKSIEQVPDQGSSPDQVLSCFLARSELFQACHVGRNELAEIDSDRSFESVGRSRELADRLGSQSALQPNFTHLASILHSYPQVHGGLDSNRGAIRKLTWMVPYKFFIRSGLGPPRRHRLGSGGEAVSQHVVRGGNRIS